MGVSLCVSVVLYHTHAGVYGGWMVAPLELVTGGCEPPDFGTGS